MPELPEVERGRRIAAAVGEGRRITAVDCAEDEIVYAGVSPEDFEGALLGRRVEAVRRRGKQLWFELDRAPHPLFHFGMTGAFRVPHLEDLPLASRPNPDAEEAWPPRFTKIHLSFEGGGELVMTNARRLGRILLREDPEHEPPISKLGFDPLLETISPAEFRERASRRRTSMKALLLDQSFAAGVGNWIADEVLYQARIDPRRPRRRAGRTKELERVRRWLFRVIERAVAVDADKTELPAGVVVPRTLGEGRGSSHPARAIEWSSRATGRSHDGLGAGPPTLNVPERFRSATITCGGTDSIHGKSAMTADTEDSRHRVPQLDRRLALADYSTRPWPRSRVACPASGCAVGVEQIMLRAGARPG